MNWRLVSNMNCVKKGKVKILALLAALIFVPLVLMSCNGDDNGNYDAPATTIAPTDDNGGGSAETSEITETTSETAAGDVADQGSWVGNVYTNASLGLTFTKPDGWVTYTVAEIAEMAGIDLSDFADPEFWDEAADITIMQAVSDTGSNVNINVTRVPAGTTASDTAEAVDEIVAVFESMGAQARAIGTHRIGNSEWYQHEYEIDLGNLLGLGEIGMPILGRGLVRIHDGFIWQMTISQFEESYTIEQILSMFS